MRMGLDVHLNHGKSARCQVSNKYDSLEHIKVLAEIITLQTVMNETQAKINVLDKQHKKIEELKKGKEDIPF